MGFFSNLFGGKKKAAPKVEAAAAKTEMSAPMKAAGPVKAEKPAVQVVTPVAEPVLVGATGAAQVKLRLKLAAALRAGELDAAYQAASGLADIQTRAGRRVAARVWREQADRILEGVA